MPSFCCTLVPAAMKPPPQRRMQPPIQSILSKAYTSAPASMASMMAGAPQVPQPQTTTSASSSQAMSATATSARAVPAPARAAMPAAAPATLRNCARFRVCSFMGVSPFVGGGMLLWRHHGLFKRRRSPEVSKDFSAKGRIWSG